MQSAYFLGINMILNLFQISYKETIIYFMKYLFIKKCSIIHYEAFEIIFY